MAKRRKGKGARGRASKSAAPPVEQEAPPAPTPEPLPAPRPREPRWVSFLLAALMAVGGLLALAIAEPRFEGLWAIGCALAVAAALGGAAKSARSGGKPGALGPLALLAGVLALMALLDREGQLHLSPFAEGQEAFVGFPSILAFVLLAAGAFTLRERPDSRRGRAALVAGLIWAAAVLLLPLVHVAQDASGAWHSAERLPLGIALDQLSAPAAVTKLAGAAVSLSALGVGVGWFLVFGLLPGKRARAAGIDPTLGVVAASPLFLLVCYHLIAPLLAAEAAPGAFGTGLTVAAGALLLASLTRDLLAEPEGHEPVPIRRELLRAADFVIPAVILGLYMLLKTHGMGPSNTDENIYFYMADDLTHGRWPYVDYFFAHPPLHVLLPGAFFAIFGYSITLAKLFSVVAGAIAGLAVWGIGRRHFGLFAAAAAMVAFLFAAETLKATTNMTGINLTIMWLMLAAWASLAGRGLAAGLLMGAAATTGFYSMAAICALLLLGIFRVGEGGVVGRGPGGRSRLPGFVLRRRFGFRQLAGFALLFGLINVVFWAVAGDAFTEGVYQYHGLKAFKDPRMADLFEGQRTGLAALFHNIGVVMTGKAFTQDLHYHAHLWTAGWVAPIFLIFRYFLRPEGRGRPLRLLEPHRFWQDGPDGLATVVWLVALALFVQYAMFRELYSFYFVLIYPFLALLLGWLIEQGLRDAAAALAPSAAEPRARLAGALGALLLFGTWTHTSAGTTERDVAFTSRCRVDRHCGQGKECRSGTCFGRIFADEKEQLGKRNPYEWKPAPVLPALSGIVRALFWEDYRIKGRPERGYRYYLWTKKRQFVTLDEVAGWIREHSEPDETIAGGSTMAPIIALAADRRLAAGEADTNNKRFKTGLLDEATYWNEVCRDKIRFLVSIGRSYFTGRKLGSLPTTRRWFRPAKVFQDPELYYGGTFPITLYERVGDPPGDGLVCRWEAE